MPMPMPRLEPTPSAVFPMKKSEAIMYVHEAYDTHTSTGHM